MISYDEARRILEASAPQLGEETIGLEDAAGHVLAQDLHARIPSPPFTNSAMDGYAFRHDEAVTGAPLAVLGTLLAAPVEPHSIPAHRAGGCVRIMTGAVVPPWADTVVKVESTAIDADGRVTIQGPVPELGANIRIAGDDLQEGQLVMRAGQALRPEHVMIAAALGHASLRVVEKPRLVILSTGDELVELGQPLPPGGIYNSSKYFLLNAARALGITPHATLTIPDAPEAAERLVKELCADGRATVILSTGAVSAGEADFIPQLAARLGFEARFHHVAIRPGKPAFYAVRGKLAWLGLPGNPISTAVGWQIFARPLLARWFGTSAPVRARLILKNEVKKPEGLRCFFRAEVNNGKAWVARRQGSAEFAASIACGAYVELPEGTGRFAPDTPVDAIII
jgi:molybdopterin molybdotransferase